MHKLDKLELSPGQCATLACVLEASAAKPGNVYRGADFEDLTYIDLMISAMAIAPAIAAAAEGGRLGSAVLYAVRATRQIVATNSNLGMVLLLTPLAMVRPEEEWRMGTARVLAGLNATDAADVYEAIRIANPGGLGREEKYDVFSEPPNDLLEAMQLAADRDLVARQYARNFVDVFDVVVPALQQGLSAKWPVADAIVFAYMTLLSRRPDSLIARKCGLQTARRVSDQAAAVLAVGNAGHPVPWVRVRGVPHWRPRDEAYQTALADFDFWLRGDGHKRNPGTTADLVTAGLFVCLRNGEVPWPLQFYS